MSPHLREFVWQRARSICEYCQLPAVYSELPFQMDHIIAEKHGGPAEVDNLCLACFYCNSFKGPNIAGIDPVSNKVVPLFHPRRQHWIRHFRWDGATLVGRTKAGRATIDVLNINEEFAVAVRQSLIDEGVFPPIMP